MQIMFCKGQKIGAQGWMVTTKRSKQYKVKYIVDTAQYNSYCIYCFCIS